MKNYLKLILAVAFFTTSFILTNQQAQAKQKINDGPCTCIGEDGICARTADGNIIKGKCSCEN